MVITKLLHVSSTKESDAPGTNSHSDHPSPTSSSVTSSSGQQYSNDSDQTDHPSNSDLHQKPPTHDTTSLLEQDPTPTPLQHPMSL